MHTREVVILQLFTHPVTRIAPLHVSFPTLVMHLQSHTPSKSTWAVVDKDFIGLAVCKTLQQQHRQLAPHRVHAALVQQ